MPPPHARSGIHLQVPDHELAAALAVFNAKCEASGLPTWDASKVSRDSPHRLYLATAVQVWVLDDHENRIPVIGSGLRQSEAHVE